MIKHTVLALGLEMSCQGVAQSPLCITHDLVVLAPASKCQHLLLSAMPLDGTENRYPNYMNMPPGLVAVQMHLANHYSKDTIMCSTAADKICNTGNVLHHLEDRKSLRACAALGSHLM